MTIKTKVTKINTIIIIITIITHLLQIQLELNTESIKSENKDVEANY